VAVGGGGGAGRGASGKGGGRNEWWRWRWGEGLGNGWWRWVPQREEWMWDPDFDGPVHVLEEDVEMEGDWRVVRERSGGGWMVYWEVWGGSGMEEGWRRRGSNGGEDGRPGRPSAAAVAWAARA